MGGADLGPVLGWEETKKSGRAQQKGEGEGAGALQARGIAGPTRMLTQTGALLDLFIMYSVACAWTPARQKRAPDLITGGCSHHVVAEN